MSQFRLYFEWGIEHILTLEGFDHILFIISLCAIYTMRDWKKVLILVTAFTVGHSITLALAALHIIYYKASIVEFLIPITILITALSNIFRSNNGGTKLGKVQLNYLYAAFFGLIHGLAFANIFRMKDSNIIVPLLSFNLGIEIGQIVVVLIFVSIAGTVVGLFGVSKREWTLGISAAVAGMALMIALQNKFW